MSLLQDHMLCPAVATWVPRLIEGTRAVRWGPPGWKPPRALRKVVADLPDLARDEPCDALVLVSPLSPTLPGDDVLGLVPTDAIVIELGVLVPGSALGRLRPWRRRRDAATQAAQRFARWVEAGLCDAEQWVSIDPIDTVVTLGRLLH